MNFRRVRLTVCVLQMMEAATEIHHEEQYPENAAMEDHSPAVQHDAMNEIGGLPLSHAVREVRTTSN